MESKVYNQKGKEVGTVALPETFFGLNWNADLVHQVLTGMQANLRTMVAHVKDRGEVRGGGKKPWRQKGTGRARHGSIRSPLWPGGGVTHGPNPNKNLKKTITKGMMAKALGVILSRKFKDGELLFVDTLSLETGKTKDAKLVLGTFGGINGFDGIATKKINALYIALGKKNISVERGFNNFGNVSVAEARNMNPLDLATYKYVVITDPENTVKFLSSKLAK